MKVITTPFEGLLILEPKVHGDERGHFYESYNMQTLLDEAGFSTPFVQDNQAR